MGRKSVTKAVGGVRGVRSVLMRGEVTNMSDAEVAAYARSLCSVLAIPAVTGTILVGKSTAGRLMLYLSEWALLLLAAERGIGFGPCEVAPVSLEGRATPYVAVTINGASSDVRFRPALHLASAAASESWSVTQREFRTAVRLAVQEATLYAAGVVWIDRVPDYNPALPPFDAEVVALDDPSSVLVTTAAEPEASAKPSQPAPVGDILEWAKNNRERAEQASKEPGAPRAVKMETSESALAANAAPPDPNVGASRVVVTNLVGSFPPDVLAAADLVIESGRVVKNRNGEIDAPPPAAPDPDPAAQRDAPITSPEAGTGPTTAEELAAILSGEATVPPSDELRDLLTNEDAGGQDDPPPVGDRDAEPPTLPDDDTLPPEFEEPPTAPLERAKRAIRTAAEAMAPADLSAAWAVDQYTHWCGVDYITREDPHYRLSAQEEGQLAAALLDVCGLTGEQFSAELTARANAKSIPVFRDFRFDVVGAMTPLDVANAWRRHSRELQAMQPAQREFAWKYAIARVAWLDGKGERAITAPGAWLKEAVTKGKGKGSLPEELRKEADRWAGFFRGCAGPEKIATAYAEHLGEIKDASLMPYYVEAALGALLLYRTHGLDDDNAEARGAKAKRKLAEAVEVREQKLKEQAEAAAKKASKANGAMASK